MTLYSKELPTKLKQH